MSRSFSLVGLSPKAEQWLKENCLIAPYDKCTTCGHETGGSLLQDTYEFHEAFYGDGAELHFYIHKDGRTVLEYVQTEPWASGPVCFLSLKFIDGTKIKSVDWTDQEIEDNT